MEKMIEKVLNLNFKTNENNQILFNGDEGRVISNEDSKKIAIHDIEVILKCKPEIKFKCDILDSFLFKEYFKGSYKFPSYIKYFTIKFNLDNYLVELKNFYCDIFHWDFNNGCFQEIGGSCDEILIYDFGGDLDFALTENISVWSCIDNILFKQSSLKEFTNDELKGIYLNSIDFSKCNASKDNEKLKWIKTLIQYFNIGGYIYFNDSFNKFKEKETKINNIQNLSGFFSSNYTLSRILILHSTSTNKIKIIFKSGELLKNYGVPIFRVNDDLCYYNFLNSAYSNFIKINKKYGFNIRLLIYYYVQFKNEFNLEIMLSIGSIFLEIVKCHNEGNGFYKKLIYRLNDLDLDTQKIFKIISPEFYIFFNKLEYDIKNVEENKIKEFVNELKKVYLIRSLIQVRNNLFHEGIINISYNNIEKIMNGINNVNAKDLNYLKDEILNKIANDDIFYDIMKQKEILEHLMEIILLRLLDVDAELQYIRPFIIKNSKMSTNSKDYINQFLKD